MNALLSVSDKTGIVALARALHAQGIGLLSTGGTAKLLAEEGLPVTEVADMTGFPEMLDGRVKTLHPKVHGGLLARRDVPAHMAALAAHGIDTVDVLVVNLYPFEATVAKAGCTLEELGQSEPGLNRLIRAAYSLLGLQTYFTAGVKEVRAWTIHVGDTGPQAAGVIHTDFEKGYIRAQTIAFDDFIAFKGEQGAKDAGKMRAEGKEYVVKDGDVLNFLFSS